MTPDFVPRARFGVQPPSPSWAVLVVTVMLQMASTPFALVHTAAPTGASTLRVCVRLVGEPASV
jgi:hypothetical protein